MTLVETIVSVFEEVAADQRCALVPISPELKIAECGLDSLSFAMAVVTLEERLGVEEWSPERWSKFPVTFGDLFRLYEAGV